MIKQLYEMNNVAMNDDTKKNSYIIAPPEGQPEFNTKLFTLAPGLPTFETIVIDTPTVEVGTADLDEL